MAVEREIKLGAPEGFVVPELDDVVPGIRVGEAAAKVLDATYYDDADLRLARAGVTLRHRNGIWTAKLPDHGHAGRMARDELDVEGPPDTPPAVLVAAVEPWLAGGRLEPVARLRTTRHRRSFVDEETGGEVAELDDDQVEVLDGDELVTRFRELEVELVADAGEAVVDAVVARLQAAGAGEPDPTPKLVRALSARGFHFS